MKTRAKIIHITSIIVTASILTGGCGLADVEELFTDPKVLDQEARQNPVFWDAAIPVAGANNLYALDNDLFLNKPYNDLYRFGDDILLVGQATYGTDENFKFSFDVYSPWRDKVIYSLRHNDIACDSYQVIGDELFLLDSTTNTLSIYDQNLKHMGTYDLSDLMAELKEFYLEDIQFFSTGISGKYYVGSESDTKFIFLDGKNSYYTEEISFDYFDYTIVGNASDTNTLIYGMDPVSLQNRFAIIDNNADSISETYIGAWRGAINNDTYIGLCDTTESYWNYVSPTGSHYFQYANYRGVDLAPDGTVIFYNHNYTEDDDSYYLRSLDMTRYASDGNVISSMSTALATTSGVEQPYVSNHYASFYEEMITFSLVYAAEEQPYLLIWDMNAAGQEAEPLALYDSEEALFLHTEHEDLTEYYRENYGINHFGTEVSLIPDPDVYDWGWLTKVNDRAKELEDRYGISIYFGPEVPDYINVYAVKRTTNSDRLLTALDSLDNALSVYPDGFLPQLAVGRNKGLRIYLVGSIKTDDATALEDASGFATELNDYKVMVLDINYAYDWDYTVAHELSHMIDARLDLLASYDNSALYSEDAWMKLHPDGFHYLDSYQNYINNDKYETYEDYFIDDYSCTFATEDRAVIFGNAVKDYLTNQSGDETFSEGTPISNKYRYYCDCIRDGFDTTDWPDTASWELFK